jgi:hypothetical protein
VKEVVMYLRAVVPISTLFFASVLQAPFLSKTSETLQQQLGKPISETYIVKPGILVTVGYGPSGQTCELVISPREPDVIVRKWPGSGEIDTDVLWGIEDELVPKSERGKHIMDTFLNIICLPENDCSGVESNWEKITIYRNGGGKVGPHYSKIEWKREECRL